jgi:NAD(P)-dependent dehydrogenase (short-subunit alcohol dehydrogenase family)
MKQRSTWTAESIPSQTGRIAVVTGANTGIGLITARELARSGALVVLAVRNVKKGELAAERIRSSIGSARLETMRLDLADLRSVEEFSAALRDRHERLDLLVNNAGVMLPPLTRTADGFELQIGVNHLGHFALTGQLLDLLSRTQDSRIITVSSGAHKIGRPDPDDLNWERRRYRALQAYADSKIANLYFTFELQRQLAAQGSGTIAVAAHPGVAITELQRHSRLLEFSSRFIAHDIEEAALPTLRAATDTGAGPGEYYGPGRFFELAGPPERVSPIRRTGDIDTARRLWDLSVRLTGVHYHRQRNHAAA